MFIAKNDPPPKKLTGCFGYGTIKHRLTADCSQQIIHSSYKIHRHIGDISVLAVAALGEADCVLEKMLVDVLLECGCGYIAHFFNFYKRYFAHFFKFTHFYKIYSIPKTHFCRNKHRGTVQYLGVFCLLFLKSQLFSSFNVLLETRFISNGIEPFPAARRGHTVMHKL